MGKAVVKILAVCSMAIFLLSACKGEEQDSSIIRSDLIIGHEHAGALIGGRIMYTILSDTDHQADYYKLYYCKECDLEYMMPDEDEESGIVEPHHLTSGQCYCGYQDI